MAATLAEPPLQVEGVSIPERSGEESAAVGNSLYTALLKALSWPFDS